MEGVKIYKDLKSIPNVKFEGYFWLSDEKEPKMAEDFDFSSIDTNPFLQEALLFCKEKNISVMIRHTGEYQITEFDFNKLPGNAVLETKEYFSHRIVEAKKLSFKQLWIPEPDENCEGMEVLTLKAHIFTCFKEPKN